MEVSSSDMPVFVYADTTWNKENLVDCELNTGQDHLEGTYHVEETGLCNAGGTKSSCQRRIDIYGAITVKARSWSPT